MATTTTDIQNQGKTLEKHETIDPHPTEVPDINTSPDADAPPKEVGGGSGDDEFKVNDGDPTANNDDRNSGLPNEDDNQKKIRRAERFGVPVQRSEQEKRNSRAERFGTVSGSHGSDEIKNSEERKRKARAERFGLEQSVPAVEEEKKKARLARFAPVLKTDPVEEEKKKARALRFSEKSSSLPLANGSKGMETGKAAITGKAGGGT